MDKLKQECVEDIVKNAKICGSMKDAVQDLEGELQHGDSAAGEDYGIADVEELFPDPHQLTKTPQLVQNSTEWVNKFLSGTKKSPFSRVKSTFVDMTVQSLRAKGYVKAGLKTEDVFSLLKRTSEPTTLYVKQKLDRDDIIDITDFEVVSYIKAMLNESMEKEKALTMLLGDGRNVADPYKVDETCIRPIYNDSDFYSIKVPIVAGISQNAYKEMIKSIIRAKKDYKGSGNMTMFTTEAILCEILLLEDSIGRPLYTKETLKNVLMVKDIICVPEMEGLTREDAEGGSHELFAILVNPSDYMVGQNSKQKKQFFDDFDIDFNQEKYLLEDRMSGALITPYSALVVERELITESEQDEPTEPIE